MRGRRCADTRLMESPANLGRLFRRLSAPLLERIDRRELRAYAIDEVKRTNGQISFGNALDLQRRLGDDDWHGCSVTWAASSAMLPDRTAPMPRSKSTASAADDCRRNAWPWDISEMIMKKRSGRSSCCHDRRRCCQKYSSAFVGYVVC